MFNPILHDPCIFALVSTHLSKWSPLPDFIGSFKQRKTFIISSTSGTG